MRSEWGLGRRLRRACWLGVACVLCSGGAKAETAGVAAHWVSGHAYATVRAAVIEAIEGEGLVPSPPLDFADMLRRTGPTLGRQQPPVERAEILQFCSARLAWQLLEEAPAQLALCPLSISLSQPAGEQRIVVSWRLPPADSPGRAGIHALFHRLLARIAADLPEPDPAQAFPGTHRASHPVAK